MRGPRVRILETIFKPQRGCTVVEMVMELIIYSQRYRCGLTLITGSGRCGIRAAGAALVSQNHFVIQRHHMLVSRAATRLPSNILLTRSSRAPCHSLRRKNIMPNLHAPPYDALSSGRANPTRHHCSCIYLSHILLRQVCSTWAYRWRRVKNASVFAAISGQEDRKKSSLSYDDHRSQDG